MWDWIEAFAAIYLMIGLALALGSEWGQIRKTVSEPSDAAEFALWAMFVMATWPVLLYLVRNE